MFFLYHVGQSHLIYQEHIKHTEILEEEQRIPRDGQPYTWQLVRLTMWDGQVLEGERTL